MNPQRVRKGSEPAVAPKSIQDWLLKISYGELGLLPVLAALMAVLIVFNFASPYFLTPRNLSNLTLQVGVLGVMALGMSLVLFIGEIDLSAGSVSGVCAIILVLLSSRFGIPGILAVSLAILCGAAIGGIHGKLVTAIGAPSFIVTLTGLLVWQGAQRMLVGNQIGQILINDPLVISIASTFMPFWLSLLIVASTVGYALVFCIRRWKLKQHAGTAGKLGMLGR
ncbi:MAG: hypothetical protein OXN84_09610, partial [Albidovulum sp.]|nr:hypothetical protein [Albidovulum sp.]